MSEFARPRLVISRCLELEKVRYNGEKIACHLVRELEPFVDLLPVCPELEIGLGVPRDPICLEESGGEVRLVQTASGRELTAEMRDFARGYCRALAAADGFLLKSRSPSCGIGDVKLHAGNGVIERSGTGLFAREVIDRFADRAAIEDEARLRDAGIRERFLTKLFALARLRQVREEPPRDLLAFHACYEPLLMPSDGQALRKLSDLVARTKHTHKKGCEALLDDYTVGFCRALGRAPRAGIPLEVPGRQEIFQPYPEALHRSTDQEPTVEASEGRFEM